jgi:hypothetical protein
VHVRLEVKVGGGHARTNLLREGRQRLVAVQRREELPNALGDVWDERRPVAEGD